MVTELDLEVDGRTLHVYDTGATADDRLVVFWHHGTPNTGAPPEPLFAAAARLGIRWVSYDRPGYGRSTPDGDRSVGSGAELVRTVADTLGIARFAVMGHSGGGSHAVACGALLPQRVVAVVSIAGLAPFEAEGLDWFAGMAPSGVEALRAAAAGRPVKESHVASSADYDPEFTPADEAALSGDWSWLLGVVRDATASGDGGLIDDDLAYVARWGADPREVAAPLLLLHGGRDRVVPASHSEWLASRSRDTELRLHPDEGHISILNRSESALDWLAEHA